MSRWAYGREKKVPSTEVTPFIGNCGRGAFFLLSSGNDYLLSRVTRQARCVQRDRRLINER